MSSDTFKCPICCFQYNKFDHAPKVLPCGHTLCSTCINGIQMKDQLCPFDRTPISETKSTSHHNFPPNLILSQLLEERSSTFSTTSDICSTHNKKRAMVCLADNVLICKYCWMTGDHKNHPVLHIGDVKKQIEHRKEILTTWIGTIVQSTEEEFWESIIQPTKEQTKQQCQESFRFAREQLDKKEKSVLEEIERHFAEEQSKIGKWIDENRSLVDEIRAHLGVLEGGNIKSKLVLETFQKEIKRFEDCPRSQAEELRNSFEELQERIEANRKEFNDIFLEKIQSFEFLGNMQEQSTNKEMQIQMKKLPQKNKDTQTQEQVKPEIQKEIQIQPYVKENQAQIQAQAQIQVENNKQGSGKKKHSEEEEKKEEPKIQEKRPVNQETQSFEEKVTYIQSALVGAYNSLQRQLVISPNHGCKVSIKEKLGAWKGFQHIVIDINGSVSNHFTKALSLLLEILGASSLDLKILFSNKNLKDEHIMKQLSLDNLWTDYKISAFGIEVHGGQKKTKVLNRFIKGLQIMKGLTSLSLDFLNSQVESEFISEFVSAFSAQKHSLQTLRLEFGNSNLSEESFQKICQVLSHCSGLKTIILNPSNNKAQEDDLLYFSTVLSELKSLENFSVSLCGSQVTDESLFNISESLKTSCKQLKIFQLDLANTRISDSGLQVLAQNLLQGMKDLKVFDLYLSNTGITDIGVQWIFFSLMEASKGLEYFRIDFPTTKVSDASLLSFREYNLPQFQKIQSLEFRMAACQVTNQGFEQLVDSVGQSPHVMKTLQSFDYMLSNKSGETTKKVEKLRAAIQARK